jgi:hypothetical protein
MGQHGVVRCSIHGGEAASMVGLPYDSGMVFYIYSTKSKF